MEKILVGLIVNFVMKDLEKFEEKVDWKKLEAELDEHIRNFFPLKFLDDEMIGLAAVAFQEIQKALSQPDKIKVIVTLLAEQRFQEAFEALKGLIVLSMSILPHEAALLAL